MSVNFTKMHGCGNDFVILDERQTALNLTRSQVSRLADRHFGIGCDQLISIAPCSDADAFMLIRNPDGSEAGACGNATRCVADRLMAETGRDKVTIRTVAGVLPARRNGDSTIEVDMGPVRLDWSEIPLAQPMDTLRLDLPGEPSAASMGNPHVTFFVEDLADHSVIASGSRFEMDPLFPQRANIGFARIIDASTIRLRVWERGAGLTLACGSGACAALVNAHRRGLAGRSAKVIVDGGDLSISWREDGHVLMAGPVAMAFNGKVEIP